MGGLNWNKAGQQCVTVYCKLFYSNSGFIQMEKAKSRLCLTHFVSQNSDEKGDGYTSNYQYFETGIVPKSFRKMSKHDPDHGEYKSHNHLWNVYRDWFTDRPVTPVPQSPDTPGTPVQKWANNLCQNHCGSDTKSQYLKFRLTQRYELLHNVV